MSANSTVATHLSHASRGGDLIALGTTFVFASAVAVVLRFWAHLSSHMWAPDDISITLAWLCDLGMTIVLNIASSKYGFNRHIWDVKVQWVSRAGQMIYISKILYNCTTGFIRLSILLFYYRLTTGTTWTRMYRIILHVAVFSVVSFCLISNGLNIFQCHPIRIYWAVPYSRQGHCRSEDREALILGIVSCVLDAVLVALPIPVVWSLKLSLRKRLEAIALLGFGFIATINGCLCTYFIWRATKVSTDYSWSVYPAYVTRDVEINVGIICACAPHIRPLGKRLGQYLRRNFQGMTKPHISTNFHPPNDAHVASLMIHEQVDSSSENEIGMPIEETRADVQEEKFGP